MTNSTLNTTDKKMSYHPIHDTVILGVFFTSGIIGLLANSVVVVVLTFCKRIKKTLNDPFLLNLACSDILLLFFNFIHKVYHLKAFAPPTKTLMYCKLFYPLLRMPLCAGVFTTAGLSVFRCYVITNPFKKPNPNALWVKLFLLVTWLLALVTFLPYPILSRVRNGIQCHFENKHLHIISLTIIEYVIPLLVIIIAYIWILVYVKRRPILPRAASFTTRGKGLCDPRHRRAKENKDLGRTVVAIVVLFAVLMLPWQIACQLYYAFKVQDDWVDLLFNYGKLLMIVNSAANPFIYTRRLFNCRKEIISWITGRTVSKHVTDKRHQQRLAKSTASDIIATSFKKTNNAPDPGTVCDTKL